MSGPRRLLECGYFAQKRSASQMRWSIRCPFLPLLERAHPHRSARIYFRHTNLLLTESSKGVSDFSTLFMYATPRLLDRYSTPLAP
jgi:hypothetical protein